MVGQGTGQIVEYANSVPYTAKLEALGQIMIEPAVEQSLRDDMVKTLESACGNEFVKTDFIAVCSSTASVVFTTNSVASATATADLTGYNVRQIVDFMKKKLIPKFDGSSYICIASTAALSGLFSDTATGGWVDRVKNYLCPPRLATV